MCSLQVLVNPDDDLALLRLLSMPQFNLGKCQDSSTLSLRTPARSCTPPAPFVLNLPAVTCQAHADMPILVSLCAGHPLISALQEQQHLARLGGSDPSLLACAQALCQGSAAFVDGEPEACCGTAGFLTGREQHSDGDAGAQGSPASPERHPSIELLSGLLAHLGELRRIMYALTVPRLLPLVLEAIGEEEVGSWPSWVCV